MPVFKWVGVGPNGETMRGEMEAMTRQAVITRLRTQRINPSPDKIKEKGKGFDREINLPSFGAPVKQHDIVIFTRQFATMIDAGLPLVQCLDILSQQSDNKVLCKTIKEVKEEVEAGSTFVTVLYAVLNQTLDVLLALLLVVGGVIGGQFGANAGQKLKGEQLRVLLALIVLAVAIRMLVSLLVTPDDLFSLSPLVGGS